MSGKKVEDTVPVWHKYALTAAEAAEYFHIGQNHIRDIIKEDPTAYFILNNGTHILIKRRLFEAYLDEKNSL